MPPLKSMFSALTGAEMPRAWLQVGPSIPGSVVEPGLGCGREVE